MLLPTISGFLFFGGGFTQRPSAASICDYYAIHRYGANSTDTQSQLMQSILALAFAGATSTMYNISSEVTGIFNPGVFQNTPVDLQAYFNGSIDSTNLNNQPVGINWLDAGGKTPLLAYLSGQSSSLFTTNTTNEYRLFSHWQAAFSRIFGCTLPKPVAPQVGGYLNLAYVHKFMDLNYTDVGHFINQLTKSSVYFGFGEQDAATLSTKMNAQYNVRCAPAVPNPVLGPQLYSLCQDETCPLAAPNADCAAYVGLGPSGANTAPASTATSAFSPSSVKPTTLPTTTSTTSSATSSATTSAAAAAATLSPGAIAGTSIGGAAVLFLFIAGLVFLFRKKKPLNDPYIPNIPSQHNPSYVAPSYTDPHMSYMSGSTQQGYGGQWVGPTIAEMESPKHGASPEMGGYVHPVPSPVYPAPERHQMAA